MHKYFQLARRPTGCILILVVMEARANVKNTPTTEFENSSGGGVSTLYGRPGLTVSFASHVRNIARKRGSDSVG